MSYYLIIDIETAPRREPWLCERAAEKVKPPGNMKKVETIEKWERDEKPALVNAELDRGALNGTFGQVTAIGWQYRPGDEVAVLAQDAANSEHDILSDFFGNLRAYINAHRNIRPVWVGCNIAGFDLRFLFQRCTALRVPMQVGLPYAAKPWGKELIDLQEWWTGGKWGMPARKEDVCRAMGIPVPDDAVSGAEMPGLFAAGDYAGIAKHVKQDVELTAQILDRYLESRP